jgi:ubiquinone biosynthesis protein COQ9
MTPMKFVKIWVFIELWRVRLPQLQKLLFKELLKIEENIKKFMIKRLKRNKPIMTLLKDSIRNCD